MSPGFSDTLIRLFPCFFEGQCWFFGNAVAYSFSLPPWEQLTSKRCPVAVFSSRLLAA